MLQPAWGWDRLRKGLIAADASGYAADQAQSLDARHPSLPTDLVPPHFPDTSGQQRHNKNHGGDSIARSDALAYPDSTQAIEGESGRSSSFTIDGRALRSPFVWKEARGQRGPDNRNSGNRPKDQFLLWKEREIQ